MTLMIRTALGLLVATAVPSLAWADGSVVPTQEQVCVDGRVDKHRLATFALDAYRVPRRFEERYGGTGPSAAENVFSNQSVCQAPSPSGEKCSSAEKEAYENAIVGLQVFITSYGGSYRSSEPIKTPAEFFSSPSLVMTCITQVGSNPPVEAPGVPLPPPKDTLPVRLRGSTTGIYYSNASPQFKSLDKATLSFSDDGSAHKQTAKIVGLISVPMEWQTGQGSSNGLYPYYFLNHDVAKVVGKAQTRTNDFYSAGIVGAFYRTATFAATKGAPLVLGSWFTIRPDYLFDWAGHSKLASLNAVYEPVLNARVEGPIPYAVNDYLRLGKPEWFLWLEPLFELHLSSGWYLQRGSLDPTNKVDFARVGPRYGLSVLTTNPRFPPVTWTLTDVHLFGINGSPRDIDYVRSELGLPLDEKQFVSINLVYTNGRREDTFKREQTWSVSVGAKY